MTRDPTLSRALEIVLSRVRAPEYHANFLRMALHDERMRSNQGTTTPAPAGKDPDAVRAQVELVIGELDVDMSFKKQHMVARIREAKRLCREILHDT